MATGPARSGCDLWLWDGSGEYEGLLVKFDESTFSARVRPVRKAEAGMVLGKRVAAGYLEVQQQFVKRRFLAHFKGTVEGTLFEASIQSVQNSADGDFDYLVSGTFGALTEKQMEMLRKMSVEHQSERVKRHVG
jgi:hypothetical protein